MTQIKALGHMQQMDRVGTYMTVSASCHVIDKHTPTCIVNNNNKKSIALELKLYSLQE